MKDKIKEYLLVVSIMYGFVIILFMVITYFKMETQVEFKTDNSFYTELNNYKNQMNNVNNEICRNELLGLISYVESNTYNGKVKIKDIFNDAFSTKDSFLSYYGKIKNSCSITDEEMKENNIPGMFLSTAIQNDEIMQKYMYQYEFSFKDYYIRMIAEPELVTQENNIKNNSELSIIKTLIRIINNKEAN